MTDFHLPPALRSAGASCPKVLLYHPDGTFRQSLTEALSSTSLEIISIGEIPHALRLVKSSVIHVAILNAGKGGSYSGFDILRQIRSTSETEAMPVLMLTEGADYERIVSLELGADDCMLAPYSNREIRLRVRSLLRRYCPPKNGAIPSGFVIDTPSFYFDPVSLEVRVAGEPLHLSGTELRILALLVSRHGAVVEKQTLIAKLSPSTEMQRDYRTINTQMRRLRKKLGPVGERLQRIRDIGYRLSLTDH